MPIGRREGSQAATDGFVSRTYAISGWRQIALGTPRLWAEFATTSIVSTDAMLQRSMETPLHVKVFPSPVSSYDSVQPALDHSPRIESLEFHIGSSEVLRRDCTLSSTAPLLQSLTYNTAVKPHEPQQRCQTTLFDKINMPRLAHLDLQFTNLPWSSPLLKPTLTELVFMSARDEHVYDTIDMLDVVRVLANMPMLERLELYHVLPRTDGASHHQPAAAVSLSRLRTMSIYAGSLAVASLLQHLQYPSSASIRIEITGPTPQDPKELLQVVLAKLTLATRTTGPLPQISAIDSREKAFRAWSEDPGAAALLPWPADSEPDVPRTPPPLLSIIAAPTGPCRPALLHKLGTIVPLEHLTTLYFDPDDRQPGLSDWLDACTALPKLRKLGVTGRGFPSLCPALEPHAAPGLLGEDDGASGDSRRSAVVLPDLKELVLRRVWMRGRQGVGDAESNLTALRAMLAARGAAGHRLHTLAMLRCVNVGAGDVALLEDLVHEVKWDGQERWLDWATRVYLRYEVSESELSDEEGSDSELEEWS